MKSLLTAVFLLGFQIGSFADAILLQNNALISGRVLTNEVDQVVIERFGRPISYARAGIRSIFLRQTRSVVDPGVPSLDAVLATLVEQPWANDARQIPATVIDKGVLKNVPYISFRCGIDYEVNAYGDGASPACVEIGIYRSLLKSESAKSNCLQFILNFIDASHRDVVQGMNLNGESRSIGGVTLEVTPPGGEDSYGGWWISVYDMNKLELSRALPKELQEITTARTAQLTGASSTTVDDWSSNDFRYARSALPVGRSSSSAIHLPSGGTVYVKSYHRKDGTYVRAHTRSAPRR